MSPEWAEPRLPTQRLALSSDCLLKPREPGFIAGAPPEEKRWMEACESVDRKFGISECKLQNVFALIPHGSCSTMPLFGLFSSVLGLSCLIYVVIYFLCRRWWDVSRTKEGLQVCQYLRQGREMSSMIKSK